MSEVVCVKVNNIRPEYHDLKAWCEDPDNYYIGRRGVVFIIRDGERYRYPPNDSPFCNPFRIDANNTREDVIIRYEEMILEKIANGLDIEILRNKKLGCWCAPEACHGDVLLRLLNDTTQVN